MYSIILSLPPAYISIECATPIYGFRPYGEALLSNSHKSTQKGLAHAYGLRCAQVPSLRSRSVGTPPRAIHGPSRLSRHPCRDTHCAEPTLGLRRFCVVGNPAGRRVSRDTARDGRSRRAHGARPVARACRATARHRGVGAKAFGHFALFKVARRKGVTLSGRYTSNGYVLNHSFIAACVHIH